MPCNHKVHRVVLNLSRLLALALLHFLLRFSPEDVEIRETTMMMLDETLTATTVNNGKAVRRMYKKKSSMNIQQKALVRKWEIFELANGGY